MARRRRVWGEVVRAPSHGDWNMPEAGTQARCGSPPATREPIRSDALEGGKPRNRRRGFLRAAD